LAADQDPDSKTEEPTQKKLSDARQKGDVVKSMDLPSWASLAASFGVLAIAGGWMIQRLAADLLPYVANPHEFEMSGEGLRQVLYRVVLAAAPMIVVVMGCAAAAGAAGSLLQTGLLFSPEKLKFDLKKLSPLAGFKRLFGVDALVQFLKSVIKLIAVGLIVWWVLKPHARELEQLVALDVAALLPFARRLMIGMFFAVLIFLGVGAGADYLWQRFRFMQRMRMSKEELKEEYKQSEGDPHVKAKLRQIRIERSRKRMMQAIPTATVVVTNPTHYAVALRYEAGETPAPICVAKGVDTLALKIREIAAAHNVPIVEDVPLARALYATVDVDEVIPRQHFEAVAKVIGFILGGRNRNARPGGARPRHT
jgi:flagellar biosynthesis protein FlhB